MGADNAARHFVMRLAVLSDIHGNVRALDAVLADIERRGADGIVNLGDCAYGPFDPRPAMQRLIERTSPSVSGNEDRVLVEAAQGKTSSRTASFCIDRLRSEQIEWLARCPHTLEWDDILAFHGTPDDDATYLLTTVDRHGACERNPSDVQHLLGARTARLILCGHDHTPRHVRLADGIRIINPGSVGCPAYVDDVPAVHAIENGSPHARYAIVDIDGPSVAVTLCGVVYDWQAAAKEAADNGFSHWAQWLATGRVS